MYVSIRHWRDTTCCLPRCCWDKFRRCSTAKSNSRQPRVHSWYLRSPVCSRTGSRQDQRYDRQLRWDTDDALYSNSSLFTATQRMQNSPDVRYSENAFKLIAEASKSANNGRLGHSLRFLCLCHWQNGARATVFALSVCASQKFFSKMFYKLLGEFHQIYNFGALGTKSKWLVSEI